MLLEKYLWKFLRKADPAYHNSKTSWSQQGEDLLIDFIFSVYLNYPKPSYLDVGANHPFRLNNTYYFYKKGCKGINIEPDPGLIKQLKKYRPNDTNINVGVGIGAQTSELDFYLMSNPTLNTFSKETALEYSKNKRLGEAKIKEVFKVKVQPINEILETYFSSTKHYFISIDVEGLDYEVLSSINFNKYRPDVICIETDYTSNKNIDNYINLLNKNRYVRYGENSINSIFINRDSVQIL